jgi:hypothetical protein
MGSGLGVDGAVGVTTEEVEDEEESSPGESGLDEKAIVDGSRRWPDYILLERGDQPDIELPKTCVYSHRIIVPEDRAQPKQEQSRNKALVKGYHRLSSGSYESRAQVYTVSPYDPHLPGFAKKLEILPIPLVFTFLSFSTPFEA